jgi:hypothetical protein
MRVILESKGNPDFGENPNKDMSPRQLVHVDTMEDASLLCQDYIAKHNLGGGNWTGGQVVDADRNVVGYISYNGRIWDKEPC